MLSPPQSADSNSLDGSGQRAHDGLVERAFAATVGWGLFALLCLVWGVLFIPLTLLLQFFWPGARDAFGAFTHRCIGIYIRSLPFMRVVVENRGRRFDGPCILVLNHQSFLDPIVMLGLERRLSGPARGYLFRTPALGSILKLIGFFEAETGAPAPMARMRQCVEEVVARGGSALFFPEGSRSADGGIGSFGRGAFRVAVDYGLPVQPVVIEGLDRVLPPGSLLVKRSGRYPVRVSYLEPVEAPSGSGSRRDVVRALAEDVRASMAGELARLRAERGSIPN